MSYYADGSWGNNQYNPFGQPGSTGGFFGTMPTGPANFQVSPILGGGSAYYDTANDGRIGLEKFLGGTTGNNSLNGNKFANYVRNNYGNLWNQYGAAQGQDPSLKWSDYLNNQQGNLTQSYANQNPYDKGEQGQKKLQWL